MLHQHHYKFSCIKQEQAALFFFSFFFTTVNCSSQTSVQWFSRLAGVTVFYYMCSAVHVLEFIFSSRCGPVFEILGSNIHLSGSRLLSNSVRLVTFDFNCSYYASFE